MAAEIPPPGRWPKQTWRQHLGDEQSRLQEDYKRGPTLDFAGYPPHIAWHIDRIPPYLLDLNVRRGEIVPPGMHWNGHTQQWDFSQVELNYRDEFARQMALRAQEARRRAHEQAVRNQQERLAAAQRRAEVDACHEEIKTAQRQEAEALTMASMQHGLPVQYPIAQPGPVQSNAMQFNGMNPYANGMMPMSAPQQSFSQAPLQHQQMALLPFSNDFGGHGNQLPHYNSMQQPMAYYQTNQNISAVNYFASNVNATPPMHPYMADQSNVLMANTPRTTTCDPNLPSNYQPMSMSMSHHRPMSMSAYAPNQRSVSMQPAQILQTDHTAFNGNMSSGRGATPSPSHASMPPSASAPAAQSPMETKAQSSTLGQKRKMPSRQTSRNGRASTAVEKEHVPTSNDSRNGNLASQVTSAIQRLESTDGKVSTINWGSFDQIEDVESAQITQSDTGEMAAVAGIGFTALMPIRNVAAQSTDWQMTTHLNPQEGFTPMELDGPVLFRATIDASSAESTTMAVKVEAKTKLEELLMVTNYAPLTSRATSMALLRPEFRNFVFKKD